MEIITGYRFMNVVGLFEKKNIRISFIDQRLQEDHLKKTDVSSTSVITVYCS